MSEIVFFLEERSAQVMLEGFLPKLIPDAIPVRFVVFEGKQDLERQMVRRMRGYRMPNARFVVLRDKDSEDCREVKSRLATKCKEASHPASLVRVACHELESWYLGDLAAVEAGLGVRGLVKLQHKPPYNAPDDVPNPARKLQSIAPTYQKIGGSRAIGPHLDPGGKRSTSFAIFVAGMNKLVADIH
jgi:hypothetical protein